MNQEPSRQVKRAEERRRSKLLNAMEKKPENQVILQLISQVHEGYKGLLMRIMALERAIFGESQVVVNKTSSVGTSDLSVIDEVSN